MNIKFVKITSDSKIVSNMVKGVISVETKIDLPCNNVAECEIRTRDDDVVFRAFINDDSGSMSQATVDMIDYIEDFASSGTDCITMIVNEYDVLIALHPGRWGVNNVLKFCEDYVHCREFSDLSTEQWKEAFTKAAEIVNTAVKAMNDNKTSNTKITY